MTKALLFVLGVSVVLLNQPAVSLALGLVFALCAGNPYQSHTNRAVKKLLPLAVIGLGFGINFAQVLNAGSSGLLLTVLTISCTLALGYLLGRLLRVNSKLSFLLSSGTAICGGSAIAAIAPVLHASSTEMSIALGTVFILNSVALLVFPAIGHFFELSPEQFGLWCAIAIHDTSSVVGAATQYADSALATAVPVKLARALWILPLALSAAYFFRAGAKEESSRPAFPFFIILFLVASLLNTYLLFDNALARAFVELAKRGLVLILFLIGLGLTLETLKSVGAKPLIHGALLWLFISASSLVLILN